MSQPLAVLSPLHFRCIGCGACCQGAKVEMVSDEEQVRIQGFAEEWGVPDAIVDGWLVQDGGRCVFLQDDNLCGIHVRHGAEAKPAVCQQFPHVLVQTEGELRGGIDPSTHSTLPTWSDAPPVTNLGGEVRNSNFEPHERHTEAVIIGWCSEPGATIASVLAHLCGAEPSDTLPDGFAGRLVQRLQAMRLDLLLQARDAGPAQKRALQPLVDAIPTWDPADPPAWPVLSPTAEAFAVELARRMVFLRLATRIPLVQGVALIALSGAVATAWASPADAAYGPALSSWSRLMRGGSFWQSLTPDPQTMQWLASGRR